MASSLTACDTIGSRSDPRVERGNHRGQAIKSQRVGQCGGVSDAANRIYECSKNVLRAIVFIGYWCRGEDWSLSSASDCSGWALADVPEVRAPLSAGIAQRIHEETNEKALGVSVHRERQQRRDHTGDSHEPNDEETASLPLKARRGVPRVRFSSR
jgi:hypothetical protein